MGIKKFSSNVNNWIEFQEDGSDTVSTQLDIAGQQDEQRWTYGTGEWHEVNAFYSYEGTLGPDEEKEVNFYSLPKRFLNYNLTHSWYSLKVLCIENLSASGSIDVGNSGLATPLALMGFDTEVGPSGIYSMKSTGIEVGATQNTIRILNRNDFEVPIKVLAMGER